MIFRKLFSFRKPKIRRLKLRPEGQCYNLTEIFAKINQQYFEGKLDLKISWFGAHTSNVRRRLVFGSYNPRNESIKINRVLDHGHIPEHFVSFIVYHEMLHHVLPPLIGKRRRRQIHHEEFKRKEKQFEHYLLAKAFREEFTKQFFGRWR